MYSSLQNHFNIAIWFKNEKYQAKKTPPNFCKETNFIITMMLN